MKRIFKSIYLRRRKAGKKYVTRRRIYRDVISAEIVTSLKI